MRKVKVSRKVWQPDPATKEHPGVPFAGKWVQQDFLAVFHDFAIDTDTSQGHSETYPVAIIERGDGSIEVVHVEHIQFVNPSLYKTCEQS